LSKPRTGAPRRVAVGLLAGALSLFGVAVAPPAGATTSVTTARLAGATRYGTAAAISADASLGTPVHAIIATGENFPDALAAAALAGANASSPIILTESGTYTTEAKSGLAALKTKGVKAVTIVGGTNAISETVEDAIEADGFTVTRVAGDDRYETAAEIAKAANTKSAAAAVGGLKSALFATGTNFPDALAGGSAAYGNKLPILLVGDTVPASTQEAISSMGIKKAYILGGTAAVSTAVEGTLVALTGNAATRLAGTNRYATATAVGDFLKTTLAYPMTSAVLATGVNFPDALASGPLAGANKAPLVLTSSLPPESQAFLDKYSSTITKLFVAGGTSVIDDATVASAKAAAETVNNDSATQAVTTRPELTGASIVETVTASQVTTTKPAGTYVRFTFDEALSTSFAPVAGNFHAYATNGTTVYNGGTATIEATATPANTSVLVNFTGANTTALAGVLTVATVDFEAVRDATSAGNPEGDASIGVPGTTTTAAGTTTAPDLLSISRFSTATSNANQTPVDFTFDQATFVATATGFHLVDTLNQVHNCTADTATTGTNTSGGNIAGGNGTTVVTALCDNAAGGNGAGGTANTTLLSAGNIARGYVDAGSVGTSTSFALANILQAADVAATSTGPDLVSVAASTLTGATTTTVIFKFDQAIIAATAANFAIYGASANDVGGAATSATISTTDATQVAVVFTNATTGFVGGTITGDGTASGSGVCSAGTAVCNHPDETGTSASTSTQTPGSTALADLTGVALSAQTDVFGSAIGNQATYSFDAAVGTGVPVANSFYLYLADGTRLQATACTTPTTTTQTTVVCTAFRNSVTLAAQTTQQNAAVLGTVDNTAVGNGNVEGAAPTTGGTGTPAS
jgi:putative cell wall-binding protein